MLKTERNTPTMGARVLRAFQKWARASGRSTRRSVTVAGGRIETRARYNADFEHGQWWITDLDTGVNGAGHARIPARPARRPERCRTNPLMAHRNGPETGRTEVG